MGGVGHLTLPPIPWNATSEAGTAYIAAARDLLDVDVCGWIVDLRVPEPVRSATDLGTMLSAVAPLLGPGPAVGYRDRNGATTAWNIREDGAVTFGDEEVAPGVGEGTRSGLPVAVLQRWSTSGSWEALLMAFRVGAHVRTFGLPFGRYRGLLPLRWLGPRAQDVAARRPGRLRVRRSDRPGRAGRAPRDPHRPAAQCGRGLARHAAEPSCR